MYKINGVTLDNAELGWTLVRGSTPVSELSYTSTELTLPGRDGVTSFPTTRDSVSLSFTVKSPLENRSMLLGLMSERVLTITRDDKPGMSLTARVLTTSVEEYHEAIGWAKDTFILQVPGGCWRDTTESTTTKAAPAAVGTNIELLNNISAPVQDAVVRIQGPITKPQLIDSSGAFIYYDATIASDEYLRFEARTGRAWLTTTNTWTGGEEVSGFIDFGGPRGRFELTPQGSVTGIRKAKITLTQDSFGAGSGVQVRAKGAYLF